MPLTDGFKIFWLSMPDSFRMDHIGRQTFWVFFWMNIHPCIVTIALHWWVIYGQVPQPTRSVWVQTLDSRDTNTVEIWKCYGLNNWLTDWPTHLGSGLVLKMQTHLTELIASGKPQMVGRLRKKLSASFQPSWCSGRVVSGKKRMICWAAAWRL